MAEHESIIEFALRVPRAVRGHAGRPTPPPSPLLPVFIAGEENRFTAFVAQAPLGAAAPEWERRQSGVQDARPLNAAPHAPAAGEPAHRTDELGLIGIGPLLLVGPSGCGKSAIAAHLATRLLEHVSADPRDVAPGKEPIALCMPGIDFSRYYARAVESDEIARFRRDIDRAPVLVIDDVHLMAGKPASQEELASRIERRGIEGRATILTCRRLPTQLAGLRPLLVSRMLPGLTVPIRLPGPAARRRLLQEFARRRNLVLGADELHLLDEGLDVDLPARNLDAAIAHIELYCRMKACEPNVHAVRAAIGATEPSVDLSPDQVAKVISRRYKVKLSDLKSGTRRQEIVRARSLAMYLTRQLTGSSYHQIGKYFGGRDHTTVLHACRKTQALLQCDSDLRVTADEVTEQLKNRVA